VGRGFASQPKDRLRAFGRTNGKLAHARRTAHRFTPSEARAAASTGRLARWPEPWRTFAIRAGGALSLGIALGIRRDRLRLIVRQEREPKMLERRAINALAIELGLPPLYGAVRVAP
jgi:hypothetical protein